MYLVQHALNDCRDFYTQTRLGTSPHTWSSHAKIIGQAWPELPMADLTKNHVIVWVAQTSRTLSASTVNHRLTFLRAACNMAVEAGHIERSPAASIKRLTVQNEMTRDLSTDEEARLATFMPQAKIFTIVRFAILTGLRRAEQFRLRVEDVDFAKKGMSIKGSKGTRWRWVPLCPEALAIAQLWAERGGPWLFLPDRAGCRIRVGRLVYNQFRLAVKEAGLPRTRWHDLRHAFASRIVQQPRATLYHAQQLLGHTDPKMTMRYAHLQDGDLRQFTDGLK